ncbi:MAG: hypothetical protein RSA10_01750 [Bacilli bacterium]
MKNNKKNIISLALTLMIGLITYYLMLPPINITSLLFWEYVFLLLIIFIFINTILSGVKLKNLRNSSKLSGYILIFISGIIVLITLTNFILSPLFNSKSYARRIVIDETGSFIKNVKPVDFNALPLLDKDSSQKLGDRVMGQMPELVSQFYVSNLYTQINYKGDIVRVTPLEYNGIFKYFSNHKRGVKGYIIVNSVTGESKLIKLDNGMKYMPSAYLSKNLNRHVRFKYPTDILGERNFEIDEKGNPFWIIPTIKYTGVNLKEKVSGIIMVNSITGESKKYKVNNIPKWVDHVYPADLIIEQVDDWGKFKQGFLNSVFGQKNVVVTTTGYNYTVMDDDVYLYTGITSATSDASNLGFILTNLRTKKTNFYSAPGAEEYSAMASAKGQVQQMKYEASFPLLINLNNKPTYLISLKDNAGLVKMYAFVDVADYQKVVVTDASKGIEAASKNYLLNTKTDALESDLLEKSIVIKTIVSANIDGNSYYFITDTFDKKFFVSIAVNKKVLPFVTEGDTLNISYVDDEVSEIIKIK